MYFFFIHITLCCYYFLFLLFLFYIHDDVDDVIYTITLYTLSFDWFRIYLIWRPTLARINQTRPFIIIKQKVIKLTFHRGLVRKKCVSNLVQIKKLYYIKEVNKNKYQYTSFRMFLHKKCLFYLSQNKSPLLTDIWYYIFDLTTTIIIIYLSTHFWEKSQKNYDFLIIMRR